MHPRPGCRSSSATTPRSRTGCPYRAHRSTRSGSTTAVRQADPGHQDHAPDPGLCRQLTGLARRYLPGFGPDLVQTERCIYDNSPDEGFIVDRVGRVVIGSGTSGHGFKFGPLLGEWLADLATGQDLPDGDAGLLARLSLSRLGGVRGPVSGSAPRTR